MSPIQIKFNKVPQQSSHGGAFISRVVSSSSTARRQQTLQPLNAQLIKGLDATLWSRHN